MIATKTRAAAELDLADGYDVTILKVPGGWTAVTRRRLNVGGPNAYRTEVLAVRDTTAHITTVMRDVAAALMNDIADGEPADFASQPH